MVTTHLRFTPATPIAGRLACLLISCSLATIGCSSKPAGMPEVAPTSGVVTMDGKPLAGVGIVFMTEKGGQVAFGGTDANGHYEMQYTGKYKGAAIGPNSVKINTPTEQAPPPNWKDPIPAKYNSESELKADVKPGQNTFNFDLKSK